MSSKDNDVDKKDFYNFLKKNLPDFFTRKEGCKYLGGLITPKTLANMDSLGSGPPKKLMGRKVMYEKQSFIKWLKNYFK